MHIKMLKGSVKKVKIEKNKGGKEIVSWILYSLIILSLILYYYL